MSHHGSEFRCGGAGEGARVVVGVGDHGVVSDAWRPAAEADLLRGEPQAGQLDPGDVMHPGAGADMMMREGAGLK